VHLEPGARVLHLTGDGRGRAAAAYAGADGPGGAPGAVCRVALLDVRHGSPEAVHRVCSGTVRGEAVTALSLDGPAEGAEAGARTRGGPTLFVGLWRPGAARGAAPITPGGRVLALAAATGAVRSVYSTAGPPRALVLAPAPGPPDRRLYSLEGGAGPDGSGDADWGTGDPASTGAAVWRLVGLDPGALEPVSELSLPEPLLWLGVSPDGREGYGLSGRGSLVLGSLVLRLDLAAGSVAPLTTLPGPAQGLAVTRDRLYVPAPERDAVWVVDRQRGTLLRTVSVGRGPVAIAAGAP
jgi:hypothetical protein